MLSALRRRIDVVEAQQFSRLEGPDLGPMPSLEDMADGHVRQLAFTTACQTKRRVRIDAARQIGKSVGLGQAYIYRCQNVPGTTNVFFGLNGVAVRENFWEPIIKRLIGQWGIYCDPYERMIVEFPNGSRLICTGTDDLTHIQNVLGNRFKAGLIGIDEMQSQKASAVRALLTSILPPTLTPESTLVLSGTIPEVPAGYWWELMQQESWDAHGWGRVELTEPMPDGLTREQQFEHLTRYLVSLNPHTPEAPQVLIDHMRDNNLDLSDPTIQRDWFGNKTAFDPNARAYFYRPEFNLYQTDAPEWAKELVIPSGNFVCAEPLPGIDTFAGSIDPGGKDPCGVGVIGWDSTGRNPNVQQLFTWVSKRDHHHSMGEMIAVASWANRRWPTNRWFIDSGAQQDHDHLRQETGLPVVKAFIRTDLDASVSRSNDLLRSGRLKVIDAPGNPLVADYTSAQWDQDALARGQHKWAATYHPTASELVRMALVPFWPAHPPKPKAKPPADPFDALHQKLEREARRTRNNTTFKQIAQQRRRG